MSQIVVGYDGSDTSKKALEKAVEFAKGLGDGLVVVFGYAPGGYGGGEVPTHRDAVKEMGEKLIKEASDSLSSAGVEVETELVDLHAESALTDVAAKKGARMIVVGSHGESPLKGAILGTTPYRLVHSSEIPVLVVRA